MLKAKIKISQINHLTDARYFSAWGVDYLTFNIDPSSPYFMSPQDVKEIIDWVEGPLAVLEAPADCDNLWIQNYYQVIGNLPVEVPHSEMENVLILATTESHISRMVTYRSEKPWSEISLSLIAHLVKSYNTVFLDIPFKVDEIDTILDSGVEGFVLHGGKEEKTGFKSYDMLDSLFEALLI